jgi:hypothetical protein
MADGNSPYAAKNPGGNSNEVQRQIPFDAAANNSWAEPPTEKKSGTSKIDPQPAWGDLEVRGFLIDEPYRLFTLCELSTSIASLTVFLSLQSKAQQQFLEPGIATQRIKHRVHFDLHDRVRMLRIHLLEQFEGPLFLACARISDQ